MKNGLLLPIRVGLFNKLCGEETHATKPRIRPRPPSKEPDELILEIRRLREVHGMTPLRVVQHLGLSMSADRVAQIFEYSTRSHLVPAATRVPYYPRAERRTDAQPLDDQARPGPLPPAGPPESEPSQDEGRQA